MSLCMSALKEMNTSSSSEICFERATTDEPNSFATSQPLRVTYRTNDVHLVELLGELL